MYRNYLLTAFLVLASMGASVAQTANYEIHGTFITNFAKYVQWPSTSPSMVVAVMGSQDLVNSVGRIVNGRKVNNSTLVVKKISSPAEIDANTAIVFLPNMAKSQFDAVKQAIGARSILLITEGPGLAKKGGMINFVDVGGKMRFEINESSIEANKMKASANLVNLAIKV